jgi:hypothetical protein
MAFVLYGYTTIMIPLSTHKIVRRNWLVSAGIAGFWGVCGSQGNWRDAGTAQIGQIAAKKCGYIC